MSLQTTAVFQLVGLQLFTKCHILEMLLSQKQRQNFPAAQTGWCSCSGSRALTGADCSCISSQEPPVSPRLWPSSPPLHRAVCLRAAPAAGAVFGPALG